MGEIQNQPFQLSFKDPLKVDFQPACRRQGFPRHFRPAAGRRWLVLPQRIDNWSLTSLWQRLVKTGGRLIKDARYYWLLLGESHLTRRLFAAMVRRIAALPVATG
jgi:hypothetical protein